MSIVRALASAIALTSAAPVFAQTPAHELQGYWAGQVVDTAPLRGELVVTREGQNWRASLAGAEAVFAARADDVRFDFPDPGGAFRGAIEGRVLRGFWLQPTAAGDEYPGFGRSRQGYATPVTLQRMTSDVWRGEITPLEQRFTLFLHIFVNDNDILVGAFRNPERNNIGGASRFRVSRDGDAVRFYLRDEESGEEIAYDAVLLHSPERLRLDWPGAGGATIELLRAAPEEIPTAFPRPRGSRPYVYARPPETGDGWRTARASEVGLDEAAVARAVQRVIDGDPSDRRPSLVHSMLIARRGRLVVEEYFFGYDRQTPHDTRSAAKTFSSVMLGAAMRNGVDIGPDTAIYPLLEDMGPFANPDPRKARITLAHLMTHASGLACDDNAEDPISPGNEDLMQEQREQADWWKYTLDLPQAHEPGVRYAYCSANINLVGAALTTATHTWLPEYFDRTIARPLQFGRYYWNLMPTGEGYLGGRRADASARSAESRTALPRWRRMARAARCQP
jgi:hypothetical protein